MTNPTLLVPIALEALVVNQHVQNEIGFSRWNPTYQNLNTFQTPIPPPFNTEDGVPDQGIYLHWVLPDSLTHGVRQTGTNPDPGTGLNDSQETLVFPYVPNRWLVVRIGAVSPNAPRTSKAWVIQSDYLDPNNGGTGTNPFPNPFQTASNTIEVTTLGKTSDLESWVEPPAAQLFLKAIGPASVTFAAYTHNVMDVFAFYDDLSDVQSSSTTTPFTYIVMGWYSDPTADPVYGSQYGTSGWTTAQQWQALMENLNWAIPAGSDKLPATSLPKQSLCQGLIYGVQWQTQTLPDRVNSDPTLLQVAVGNTGIDAFAALIESVAASSGQTVPSDLIEAFQYNLLPLLDQSDGDAQLDLKVRQAWFGSSPGGYLWQIVPSQRSDLIATNQPEPQPTPSQIAKLATLNQAQVQLDQQRRQLDSLQSQLYDIWWKQQFVNTNGYSNPNNYPEQGLQGNWQPILTALANALDTSNSNSLISQIIQLQAQIQTQATALPDPQDNNPDPEDPNSTITYGTNVIGLTPDLVLKAVPQDRFYHPSDPVLMIGGIEWPDRYLYGGQSNPTAALPTRLDSQTLNGLTVGSQTVTAAQVTAVIPTLSATGQGKLPSNFASVMLALLQEAFFLDIVSATAIATAVPGLNATDISNAIAAGDQVPTANQPASIAVMAWAQAWSPLFLEWEVAWEPTPGTSSTPGKINWDFDGSDYEWAASSTLTPAIQPQSYRGRIFLSPHITLGFIARLQQYIAANPNDPDMANLQKIEALIQKVGQWNFLSQTLSGLTDLLILQDAIANMPPSGNIASAIGSNYDTFPFTAPGAATDPWNPPVPSNYFFPIRAGHFQITALQIVDRFGQVLNLLKGNNNPTGNANSFYPLRGEGVIPDPNSNLPYPQSQIKLPPRLIQSSRLEFELISASNDQQPSDLYADANPVCGWLLPNHLDRSLDVYDNQGNLLGELLLVVNPQGQSLTWQTNPGSSTPIEPAQIANSHLQGFVQQLLAFNHGGTSFQALLQTIDETLWTVDPLGGRDDQELSVLIGRPIALVRAKLQLMLEGNPVQDQAWSQTLGLNVLHETNFDFTQVQFSVKLGSLNLFDDGLLGYFVEDNYQQFNSVHSPALSTPYITPIGVNSNYLALAPNYLSQPAAQQTPIWITMLLDPRGKVHATTGILPTQTLILPEQYVGNAIASLNIAFRINGLLTDPDAIRIPVPGLKAGIWSWIERSDPQTWDASLPIVKANANPRLAATPPVIHEGWLKLVESENNS